MATQRIGTTTRLRVVDAILSGTHGAFIDPSTLQRLDRELNTREYRTHEFGDSVYIERIRRGSETIEWRAPPGACRAGLYAGR